MEQVLSTGASTVTFLARRTAPASEVAGGTAPNALPDVKAEQLLINAVATCPIFQSQQFWQVRSCVHNWTLNASATTPLDSWLQTYIDPSCPNV